MDNIEIEKSDVEKKSVLYYLTFPFIFIFSLIALSVFSAAFLITFALQLVYHLFGSLFMFLVMYGFYNIPVFNEKIYSRFGEHGTEIMMWIVVGVLIAMSISGAFKETKRVLKVEDIMSNENSSSCE